MQEVVQAEVLKLLQAGIIYPISDNTRVSPTQVVPKKSGVTIMHNEKGEEMPTRLTTGWRLFSVWHSDSLSSVWGLNSFSSIWLSDPFSSVWHS